MEHLPPQLKHKPYIYLPYPDVIVQHPQLISDSQFWIEKAAMETGENWEKSSFQKFFKSQNFSDLHRYIRALAYTSIAVPGADGYPGSEIILDWEEMVRHAVEGNNDRLFNYCVQNAPPESSGEILHYLLSHGKIDHLIKFYKDSYYKIAGVHIALEQFFLVADIKTVEKLYRQFMIIRMLMIDNQILDHLNNYRIMLRGKYNGDSLPIKTQAILLGKEVRHHGLFFYNNTAKILSDILTEDIDALKEERLTDQNILSIVDRLISYKDNPQIFQIMLDKTVELTKRYSPGEERRFVLRILRYTNYGSNIFNYILDRYEYVLKEAGPSDLDLMQVIKDKSRMDFTGLAIIFEILSPEVREEWINETRQTEELKTIFNIK